MYEKNTKTQIKPLLQKDITIIDSLIRESRKRKEYKCDYYIDKLNSTYVEVKRYYEEHGFRVQRLGASYCFSIYWNWCLKIVKKI